MRRGYKIFIIVVLQIVFLFCMIGFKYYTLHFGEQILLKTMPVDPWDAVRGEYVRLNYEISRINEGSIKNTDFKKTEGKNVYVVLEKDGRYWKAEGIYNSKPALEDGQVFIKARLDNFDYNRREYILSYGIESYYVPEGQGSKLERQGSLDVTVRVDRFGNSVIERVGKS